MSEFMTLEQFRTEISEYLKRYAGEQLLDNLENYLAVYRYRLPLFPSDQCCNKLNYGAQYTPDGENYYSMALRFKDEIYYDKINNSSLQTFHIKPAQCIGDTWLFENDRSEGRPIAKRLAPLLVAPQHTGFFVIKAGEYYYCSDGNHRIYAAYLMGRDVLVDCYEEYEKSVNVAFCPSEQAKLFK